MGFHLNPLYIVESPEAKTFYVDIPYGDGSIDLTEAVTGKVSYENRLVQFVLERLRPKDSWQSYYNNLVKNYHGKTIQLVMPDMEGYHLIGRMIVGQFTKGDYLSIPCEVNCKPYKLKNTQTILEVSVDGTQEVLIENEQMTTVPKFTTDASVQIVHGANTYSINAGTHTLPIVLEQGDTAIQINGTANVTIAYQEGIL